MRVTLSNKSNCQTQGAVLRVCNEITYPIMELKKIETTRLREDYHKINLVKICVISCSSLFLYPPRLITTIVFYLIRQVNIISWQH